MTLVRRFNNQMPTLNNMFDDFFGKDFFYTPAIEGKHTLPSINVKENENEYMIEVAAPGLKKENFAVEIENNVLTISYEQKEEKENKDKGVIRHEFNYSSFRRSFSIPKNEVDDSKIDANYKDGILNITLQKRAEVKPKPARTIEIKWERTDFNDKKEHDLKFMFFFITVDCEYNKQGFYTIYI